MTKFRAVWLASAGLLLAVLLVAPRSGRAGELEACYQFDDIQELHDPVHTYHARTETTTEPPTDVVEGPEIWSEQITTEELCGVGHWYWVNCSAHSHHARGNCTG